LFKIKNLNSQGIILTALGNGQTDISVILGFFEIKKMMKKSDVNCVIYIS